MSVCLLLPGRCGNSGRTAAYRAIRSQTRYISGGEQETEYDRHNLSLGAIILYRHIPTIRKFCKVTCLCYLQTIISLQPTDYCFNVRLSIKLIVNVIRSALNVLHATCSPTKIFKNCSTFQIYLQ